MLNKTSKILIEGDCVVDESIIARFVAKIDIADPTNINFATIKINKELCKEHRDVLRADQANFEDYAYSIQDKYTAETV